MLTKQQYFLEELAKRILLEKITPEDRHYLSSCIYALSRGEDAREIFKTAKAKGARNERVQGTFRKKMAITLIAAYMRPKYESESDFSRLIPSGEGLSEKEAIDKAYAIFKVEDGKSLQRMTFGYVALKSGGETVAMCLSHNHCIARTP